MTNFLSSQNDYKQLVQIDEFNAKVVKLKGHKKTADFNRAWLTVKERQK